MSNPISEFNDYRSRMNKQLLEGGSNTLKRIFSLDKQAFQEGVLDVATKELLGLAISSVSISDVRVACEVSVVEAALRSL